MGVFLCFEIFIFTHTHAHTLTQTLQQLYINKRFTLTIHFYIKKIHITHNEEYRKNPMENIKTVWREIEKKKNQREWEKKSILRKI